MIFLVRSNYINNEVNYERLIDFLCQISKLSTFDMLDLADFMMHHWFPVSFFCANTAAHLCLQYASFRASPSTGSSGGLIIMAHASLHLFFLLSNFTYNSHIMKNENFLAYFTRILNSCLVYKFQTVNPTCQPSQPHAF